ncbi:MAG: transcriptional regulator [Verrucomicrobiae bacterium]|nr:transcriptional regulator [Verrucomicrobiae bacterium]
MSLKNENPYAALEKIFHEPSRLAIMSALCAAADGLTFNEIKKQCDLTDGNLSRHLKVLEEAGSVSIRKAFVKSKPQTTVMLSEKGRASFLEYLKALEEVLKQAAKGLQLERKPVSGEVAPGGTAIAEA